MFPKLCKYVKSAKNAKIAAHPARILTNSRNVSFGWDRIYSSDNNFFSLGWRKNFCPAGRPRYIYTHTLAFISSFESNCARFASGLGLNVCSFPALRPGFGTDAAGEGYELFKEAMAEIGILLCRHIHHPPNRGLVLCDEQHCLREQHPILSCNITRRLLKSLLLLYILQLFQ